MNKFVNISKCNVIKEFETSMKIDKIDCDIETARTLSSQTEKRMILHQPIFKCATQILVQPPLHNPVLSYINYTKHIKGESHH